MVEDAFFMNVEKSNEHFAELNLRRQKLRRRLKQGRRHKSRRRQN